MQIHRPNPFDMTLNLISVQDNVIHSPSFSLSSSSSMHQVKSVFID